ncbi:glycosyltransferase family 4 protein [Fontisphaera persica]|uniref:glycosyltransferase family 4 protein n=1 Tax=Fontisphaera persica TaxID=2974023 RepID=UPI0024BF8A48|nr:glycosyltransferase family 4 protein [Fontisphaera persica]WCJ60862.1 glycosyltransferase family 4 protein [Fontisphaera persica]
MKILFSHDIPFHLAHGGSQTHIESLMRELAALGEEVEPERWWDEQQTGDIIHYIGRRAPAVNVRLAHQKGYKVVMTEFLDMTASRPRRQLWLQRLLVRLGMRFLPAFTTRLSWESFRTVDALIFCSPIEPAVAQYLFDADPQRCHYISHGLEADVLAALAQPDAEEDYLISMATIAPRKRTVWLAEAARSAQVPVLFLGKPYAETDSYYQQFCALVDNRWVRYAGFVSEAEKQRLLRRARGFALLSEFETGCIAVYEASAAGLPLFLSRLPWATGGYPTARHIQFCPLDSPAAIARRLREFYEKAHRFAGHNFPVPTWRQVAEKTREVYRQVLAKAPA